MAYKRRQGEEKSRFEREAERSDLGTRSKKRSSVAVAAMASEAHDEDGIIDVPSDPIRAALLQKRHSEVNQNAEDDIDYEDEDENENDDEDKAARFHEGESESGSLELEAEQEGSGEKKAPKRRRGRTRGSGTPGAGMSWAKMQGITSVVPVDRSKLAPRALRELISREEKPTQMRLCLIPPETTKVHYAGFLSLDHSSNLLDHFRAHHPKLFAWMEKARMENDDLVSSFANFLQAHRSQAPPTMRQLNLANFAKRVTDQGMEPGAIKEIAHALKIVGTDASFRSADDPIVSVCDQKLGVRLPGADATRSRVGLIAHVVRGMRRDQLIAAKFFSITFDFATVQGESVLLLTYHMIPRDFSCISSFGLDVIVFPGPHYSSHIAIAAQHRIDARTSDDCVLVQPLPDGAADVQKAGFILAGNIELLEAEEITVTELLEEIGSGDAGRCFAHAEHLLVTDALGSKGQLGTAKAISQDLAFVHSMAVYFSTFPMEAGKLQRLQKEEGMAVPLRVLGVECETRWNDRELALKRFLQLRRFIEGWYLLEGCPFHVDVDQFPDALTDPFWTRVAGAQRVLAEFARWSRLLQTEGEVAGSWLPRCVAELRSACIRIEGSVGVLADVDAVVTLKSCLLEGIEKYLSPHVQRVSSSLKAAVLDPNEAFLAAFGIDDAIINAVWEAVAEEVGNYSPSHKSIAKTLLPELRALLEKSSHQVKTSGKRVNVVGFWRALKEVPLEESLLGAVFSETARAILTIQLSSASTERRVKALKHILTQDRNQLGEITVEDLFVVRDWLKEGEFTTAKFDELTTKIQAFIVKD